MQQQQEGREKEEDHANTDDIDNASVASVSSTQSAVLHEIASLLLMLHDHYLQSFSPAYPPTSNMILLSLVQLVVDTGLYDTICILDVERLRRHVTRHVNPDGSISKNNHTMGYEIFYDWLKQLSIFIFDRSYEKASPKANSQLKSRGKRELHHLLTHHIIPYTSKMEQMKSTKKESPYKSNHNHKEVLRVIGMFTDKALSVMSEYSEFLQLLFLDIIQHDMLGTEATLKGNHFYCNDSTLWQRIVNTNGGFIANTTMISYFTAVGIIPSILTEKEANQILTLCDNCSSGRYNESSLNFVSFLYFLELLSERYSPSKPHKIVVDEGKEPNRLFHVIHAIAERKLIHTVHIRLPQCLHPGRNNTTKLSENERIYMIYTWMKQSGFLHFTYGKFLPLYLQSMTISKHAKVVAEQGGQHNSDKTQFDIETLPRLLLKAVKFFCGESSAIFTSEVFHQMHFLTLLVKDVYHGRREEDTAASSLALLAIVIPSLFFPGELAFDIPLYTLYSRENVAMLAKDLDSILAQIQQFTAQQPHVMSRLTQKASFYNMNFFQLALHSTKCYITKSVVTALDLQQALFQHNIISNPTELRQCQHIMRNYIHVNSSNPQVDPKESTYLDFTDVLEILYVMVYERYMHLQQNQVEQVSTVHILQKQVFSYFLAVLAVDHSRCQALRLPDDSEKELGVTSSANSSNYSLQTLQANEASPLDAVSFSTNTVAATQPMGYNASQSNTGNSIHDIVKLLMHFPESSFALNPWKIATLYTEVASQYKASIHSNDFDENVLLTKLLKSFGQQYHVTLSDLSAFFAAFYVGLPEEGSSAGRPLPLKQLAINSPILKLVMEKHVLRLLSLNEDLLKFEYGRCLVFFNGKYERVYGAQLLLPFVTNDLMTAQAQDAYLPMMNAILWAQDNVKQLPVDRIVEYFNETVSLSGFESYASSFSGTEYVLTFSTFVLFALRCFTADLFATTADDRSIAWENVEKLFIAEVKKMLYKFSEKLSHTQQSLQLRVLDPMFSDITGTGGNSKVVVDDTIKYSLCKYSLEMFKARMQSHVGNVAHSRLYPVDRILPPRPPVNIWDAPRFIEYCRYFGPMSCGAISMDVLWAVFGVGLSRISGISLDGWEVAHVSPLPVTISASLLSKFLDIIHSVTSDVAAQYLRVVNGSSGNRADAFLRYDDFPSNVALYYKHMTPVLVTLAEKLRMNPNLFHPSKVVKGSEIQPDQLPLLEDLLRFGGGVTMQYLMEQQGFYRMSYFCLQEKARGAILPAYLMTDDHLDRYHHQIEVPAPIVVKFFTAGLVLTPSEVYTLIRGCLHNRLRPAYKYQTPPDKPLKEDLLTLSYNEFEELFLRCSFHVWYRVLHEGKAKTGPAASNANNNSSYNVKNNEFYRSEVKKVLDEFNHSAKDTKRRKWGKNFLKPFTIFMQKNSEFNMQLLNHFKDLHGFDRPQLDAVLNQRTKKNNQGGGDANNKTIVLEESFDDNNTVSTITTNNSVTSADILDGGDNSPIPPQPPSTESPTTTGHPQAMSTPAVKRPSKEMPHQTPKTAATIAQILSPKIFQHSVAVPAARKAEQGMETIPEGDPSIQAVAKRFFTTDDDPNTTVVNKVTESVAGPSVSILAEAKESLWPIFATYCSCADSLDPGKLSGPNLFTLLSKLGVLTDNTLMTDAGIVFHQVASKSFSNNAITTVRMFMSSSSVKHTDTPSLTFEEFLVFLYAFATLRYEGEFVSLPESADSPKDDSASSEVVSSRFPRNKTERTSSESWVRRWQDQMASSNAFKRLLTECVIPIVQKQALLAFPEDARLRDKFACVFSLQALTAVENIEGPLQAFFEREMRSQVSTLEKARSTLLQFQNTNATIGNGGVYETEILVIMNALKGIGLIPRVMNETQVLQLVNDVLPESYRYWLQDGQPSPAAVGKHSKKSTLLFPQWEWVLCVVAYQAVESAVRQSPSPAEIEKIPQLVADVITSIATAITTSATNPTLSINTET